MPEHIWHIDLLFGELNEICETDEEKYAQYKTIFLFLNRTLRNTRDRLEIDEAAPTSQAMPAIADEESSDNAQDYATEVHAVHSKKKKKPISKP